MFITREIQNYKFYFNPKKKVWQKKEYAIDSLEHVNLSGVDFSFANLSGLDLSFSNLSKANLRGVNLEKASLYEANMKNSSLNQANLKETNLQKANLNGIDFSESDLWKADLRGAKLKNANLCEANLCKANLHESNLEDANLSSVYFHFAQGNTREVKTINILDYHIVICGNVIAVNWMQYSINEWLDFIRGLEDTDETRMSEIVFYRDFLKPFIYFVLSRKLNK